MSLCDEALFPKGEGKVNKPQLYGTACFLQVETRHDSERVWVSLHFPFSEWEGEQRAVCVLIPILKLSHTSFYSFPDSHH